MATQRVRLMIAGPVDVEDDILAALAEPTQPHYGKEWLKTYGEAIDRLKQLFGTTNDLFLMPGAGTTALDAALGSMTRTGDKVLVGDNGFFGHRLGLIAKGYGLELRTVKAPLGEPLDPDEFRRCLAVEGDIQAVGVVHLETSTGVLNPLQELAAVANEYGVPILVDAVSSMGGMPLPVDEWGIDLCVSVANKCLGCPPGLAFVSVSQPAWQQMQRKGDRAHGYLLDLLVWKEYAEDWSSWHPYPVTLPTNNIVAVLASLRRILDGGLPAFYERHRQASQVVRAGLRRMGFELFAPEAHMSPLVTAVRALPGMDIADFQHYLVREWQTMISGGLEELNGKIYRVGHIGRAVSPDYTARFLEGTEAYLRQRGYALPSVRG